METMHNWWEEKRSAYLYAILAEYETNILHKKLFLDLKTAAETQAHMWENKIRLEDPQAKFQFKVDLRTRLVALLVRIFGTETLHSMLAAMKIRGMSVFSNYHVEHKHTGLNSASNLRAAIFGINDGLISNMSLILGLAGASSNVNVILLAGTAGLLAGACSMGAGEYISVRSQREVYEYQIAIERQELDEYPEEEAEELSLIYQARGINKTDADTMAGIMTRNKEVGLNTLAREELGLNPDDLVSPLGAMLASFFAFSIGAALPLIPFIWYKTADFMTLSISIGITACTLLVIGLILSLFTNRNPIFLALRMLTIGVIAGGLTFVIGKFLGIATY